MKLHFENRSKRPCVRYIDSNQDVSECAYLYQYAGYEGNTNTSFGEFSGLVKELGGNFSDIISKFSDADVPLIPAIYSNPNTKGTCDLVHYYLNLDYFDLIEDKRDPQGFRLKLNLEGRTIFQYRPMNEDFSAPLSMGEFHRSLVIRDEEPKHYLENEIIAMPT